MSTRCLFRGAQAASLLASAACRGRVMASIQEIDVQVGCRQAAGNYRLTACAPQNWLQDAALIVTVLLAFHGLVFGQTQPLDLALPTDNDALFQGGGPEF